MRRKVILGLATIIASIFGNALMHDAVFAAPSSIFSAPTLLSRADAMTCKGMQMSTEETVQAEEIPCASTECVSNNLPIAQAEPLAPNAISNFPLSSNVPPAEPLSSALLQLSSICESPPVLMGLKTIVMRR